MTVPFDLGLVPSSSVPELPPLSPDVVGVGQDQPVMVCSPLGGGVLFSLKRSPVSANCDLGRLEAPNISLSSGF
jgi:hypothetical protein